MSDRLSTLYPPAACSGDMYIADPTIAPVDVSPPSIPGSTYFEIPKSFWRGFPSGDYIYGDHEVWLRIADPDSEFESDRILYDMMYMQSKFHRLRRGSYEDRQPNCPKCGKLVSFILPASGLLTEKEVQDTYWRQVLTDLERSCPNHHSKYLKPVGN